MFHEKQRLELCAIHALNNVLQERVFTKETADDICKRCVTHTHTHTAAQKLGICNIFFVFFKGVSSSFCSSRLYLFDQKYRKDSNIVKYFCNV